MPHKIIALLKDGNTHSGVELGRALKITRSAVSKQIAKLKEMGFEVECVKGVGYRIAMPFDQLDASAIKSFFAKTALDFIPELDVLWSIPSTNDYVASKIKNGEVTSSGFVCVAEHQSAGRGRRGKLWASPLGGGLYLSLAWRFEQGAESLEGFSLSVAMAIIKKLEQQFLIKNLKIKWPNDIFLDEKKVGGILIDVMGEAGGPCWVVVGVGLNIYGDALTALSIDQPWTTLSAGAKKNISRNQLASSIVVALTENSHAYASKGFEISEKEWNKYDVFYNKKVIVKMGEAEFFSGVSKGISSAGGLIVESDGVRRVMKSGEVSLRGI
ncbi:MAG: biotin--[acetyl-CoA-carboxylase] ligase [Pseudomonadales bacterium]